MANTKAAVVLGASGSVGNALIKELIRVGALGRSRRFRLRADWESVKVDVMRRGLEARFRQHDEMRTLLLSTNDEDIIEDTDTDDFWGCGTTVMFNDLRQTA